MIGMTGCEKKESAGMNRRTFLSTCGATLLSFNSFFLPSSLLAEKKTDQPLIDTHHHILPPEYVKTLSQEKIQLSGGLPFPSWSIEQSLSMMERNNIEKSVVSISTPGVFFGDHVKAAVLARKCNDFMAGLTARFPFKFGAFGILPLPNIKNSLKEYEHIRNNLHLDGVSLLSNYEGLYLGDQAFHELYAELNHHGTIVFIHPTLPFSGKYPEMSIPPAFLEFLFDTTRSIASLLQNQVFLKFPRIKFIIAHGGGVAPYLLWKMSLIDRYQSGVDNNATKQLSGLYYDTALSTSAHTMELLLKLAGEKNILFGSDYVFAPETVSANSIYQLKHMDNIGKNSLQSILFSNARQLLNK